MHEFVNKNDDEHLLARMQKDDNKSFEMLFKRYYSDLCRYADGIVKDEEAAKDIVVDSYLKIWEIRKNLKIHKSFRVYIFRQVHNKSLNYLRHQGIKSNYRNEVSKSVSLQDFNDPDHPLYRLQLSELKKRIDSAIKSLPEKCRRIFEMNRFEDKSYREIAECFGITISTVQTQVRRALERIIIKLEEDNYD